MLGGCAKTRRCDVVFGREPPLPVLEINKPLGKNFIESGPDGQIVLLIRGELLRRYPTATIYAVKAAWSSDGTRRTPGKEERYPLFRGTLDPDITFVGFGLTVKDARGARNPNETNPGWFFVIQQQPTEPRFGLGVANGYGERPDKWDQLSWGHLAEDEAGLSHLTHATISGPLSALEIGDVEWGYNSAHMAQITLQRPVRIAVHADAMLPSE